MSRKMKYASWLGLFKMFILKLYYNFKMNCLVLKIRVRYWKHQRRLKKKSRLKVLFLVAEHSKWKAQSVYEAMLQSTRFDPFVGPTIMNIGFTPNEMLKEQLLACRDAFRANGVRICNVCDYETTTPLPLNDFCPDIIIYQQPWGIPRIQSPEEVSKIALTFYLPYYIMLGAGTMDSYALAPFLRMLYVQFFESKVWVDAISKLVPWYVLHGLYIPIGCPMREEIVKLQGRVSAENCIIYAPHWSFRHPLNVETQCAGTFLETGKYILQYAQEHSDIHWVFKPHPGLRGCLIKTGVMTVSEVDEYFAKWAALGEVCTTGDYIPLFYRSKAMITDSESFLAEYTITDKPLIRLVPTPDCKYLSPGNRLMEALYEVRTRDELRTALNLIVERGQDPKKYLRSKVLKSLGYDDNNISKRFLDVLDRLVRAGKNYERI